MDADGHDGHTDDDHDQGHTHSHSHGDHTHHHHAPDGADPGRAVGPGDGHPPGPLDAIGHVDGGAPLLDIGGDIGAVVALLDPAAAGTEIHLRRPGAVATVHTGVWSRRLSGGEVTAAVFCELEAGRYEVLDPAGRVTRSVTVDGGEVTEIDLRS